MRDRHRRDMDTERILERMRADTERTWLETLPQEQRGEYWKLLAGVRFEVALEHLITAMDQVIEQWPTESTFYGRVAGKVSATKRDELYARYGLHLRELRRLWKQIDYRMKAGAGVVDGPVVDSEA